MPRKGQTLEPGHVAGKMVTCRMHPGFIRRMDACAAVHGWTRTTYILRALGAAVRADEAIYGVPTGSRQGPPTKALRPSRVTRR